MTRRERRAYAVQEKLHRHMIGEVAKRRLAKLHQKQLSKRDPLKGMPKCIPTLRDLFWDQFIREQKLQEWEITHNYCHRQGLQYKTRTAIV